MGGVKAFVFFLIALIALFYLGLGLKRAVSKGVKPRSRIAYLYSGSNGERKSFVVDIYRQPIGLEGKRDRNKIALEAPAAHAHTD